MSKVMPLSVEGWFANLFSSRAARDGKVIRRDLDHVDRYVGRQRFYAELERREFHAVENANQVVIFCNQEPIRVTL